MNEAWVEDAALSWLADLGYTPVFGPSIAPGEACAERDSYGDVLLSRRLRHALARLNPAIPAEALEDAFNKVVRPESASLIGNNHAFHRRLVEGVEVEYRRPDGSIAGDHVRLVDFDDPDANDWLAVNQFTVVEDRVTRRADLVMFVNGLPLAIVELKNAADENTTVWTAFNQLQTYKQQIPSLFTYNEMLVVSDGVDARIGTLTAEWQRFMPWRTVDGDDLAPPTQLRLEVLLRGVFGKRRFLDLLRHFIVFETPSGRGDGAPTKKMAGYHQYHAVQTAVETTVAAASPEGDRRAGVVWHTQGSGKSLTMAFFAGRIVLHPAMENPTLVVLTDRNDLDDQLFGTFSRCQELLRQAPVQAESRDHLRRLLHVAAGGVVFTTVQKFFPDVRRRPAPAAV